MNDTEKGAHRTSLPVIVAAVIALIAPVGAAAGQAPDPVTLADSLSTLVHRGLITGDVDLLQSARRLARRALRLHPDHPVLEHHLAETYFRQAGPLLGSDRDSADVLLERAQEILDRAVERDGAIAATHALRASVLGMRITGMLSGMTLGPRAGAAIERAMELGPTQPLVWLSRGIGTLHRPGFMGGGPDAAIEEFERGIALLEAHEPPPGHPHEPAAELWMWLGIAHQRADRPAEAQRAYQRALEIQPRFSWVSNVLLPAASDGT